MTATSMEPTTTMDMNKPDATVGTIAPATPPHVHTESSLAPTSEFMRYVLAAWSARYFFRGAFSTLFDVANTEKGGVLEATRHSISKRIAGPGNWLQQKFPNSSRGSKMAMAYNTTLGLGSAALTLTYSGMVYKDIKNIFCETVGEELGKPADKVTFRDISRSQNKIVKQTIDNFWGKLGSRLAVDSLFLPAAWLRSTALGDWALGGIGVQLFADTWKRKTTMFEDLVTLINNKLNPRNGLGQPIAQGEIFDLYQHYNEKFHPEQMFSNVMERGTGEGAIWASSQPIFQRIAELMNETYAYKHSSKLDPNTGHAIKQANFALPQFIYLLGNDLINAREPERSLTLIEIANAQGIPAVKQAAAMFSQGTSPADVRARFNVTLPEPAQQVFDSEKNGVLPKHSTMQLDQVPSMKIDLGSISHSRVDASKAAELQA